MHNSLARQISGVLIVQLLLATSPLLAQQQSREENRPRRVISDWNPTPAAIGGEITSTKIPAIGPEPKIRVALATDARSAVISTTGRLMNASGEGTTLVALETSRVRVEPRLLSPYPVNLNQDVFQLAVGPAETREEAEQAAREVKKLTGEETKITFDAESKSWGLLVGGRHSRDEAEELRARLEDSGLDASITSLSQKAVPATEPNQTGGSPSQSIANTKIRLASRPGWAGEVGRTSACRVTGFSSRQSTGCCGS